LGGGIATFLDDLIHNISSDISPFVMYVDNGFIYLKSYSAKKSLIKTYPFADDLKISDFNNESYRIILTNILIELDIAIIHLNSQIKHTFDIFEASSQLYIPIILTVHDFFYCCPTIHLVDNDGIFCGKTCLSENNCNKLEGNNYLYSNLSFKELESFRSKFRSYISEIDMFVFPSVSSKNIFNEFYNLDESRTFIIPHGSRLKKNLVPNNNNNQTTRVGIIGNMLKHKGSSAIQNIINNLNNNRIEFHHFGDGNLYGKTVVKHGRYNRTDIVNLLLSNNIDVSLFMPTWPETFSYTLSESIAASIPPIVSNFGAMSERVMDHEIGWVVNFYDPNMAIDLLIKITNDKDEISTKINNICKVKLKDVGIMQKEYADLYYKLNKKQSKKISFYGNSYFDILYNVPIKIFYYFKKFFLIIRKILLERL
jgi:glycosyltransferase involved in cell wall biosynthesis